jgi:hypothetical protein
VICLCIPFFLFGDVGLEDFFIQYCMDFFLDGERRYSTVCTVCCTVEGICTWYSMIVLYTVGMHTVLHCK